MTENEQWLLNEKKESRVERVSGRDEGSLAEKGTNV